MVDILTFLKDESGHTTTEYGFLAALVAGTIIAGLSAIGAEASASLDLVTGKIEMAAYEACVGSGTDASACQHP